MPMNHLHESFHQHMERIAGQMHIAQLPSKVQRFVHMYEAGLPIDSTVRWFPLGAFDSMQARVSELIGQQKRVWISQALPSKRRPEEEVASVQKKTDLIKNIDSVETFRNETIPRLREWDTGSWAKIYFESSRRALVAGVIRLDTNRQSDPPGTNKRKICLEGAFGVFSIRELGLQLSNETVLVVHSSPQTLSIFESALEPLNFRIKSMPIDADTTCIMNEVQVTRPKMVVIDHISSDPASIALLHTLKNSEDVASVPVILIADTGVHYPLEIRMKLATILRTPLCSKEIQSTVFKTGFQLVSTGDGFQIPMQNRIVRKEIGDLLRTILGLDGEHGRAMMRIANAEARPCIAFEYKLVPVAPFDFFFIDYEWAGPKSDYHNYDWVTDFAVIL